MSKLYSESHVNSSRNLTWIQVLWTAQRNESWDTELIEACLSSIDAWNLQSMDVHCQVLISIDYYFCIAESCHWRYKNRDILRNAFQNITKSFHLWVWPRVMFENFSAQGSRYVTHPPLCDFILYSKIWKQQTRVFNFQWCQDPAPSASFEPHSPAEILL